MKAKDDLIIATITLLVRKNTLMTHINKIVFFLEQSYCHVNPCLNGGSCREADDHFTCACPSGFHGATCSGNLFIVSVTLTLGSYGSILC